MSASSVAVQTALMEESGGPGGPASDRCAGTAVSTMESRVRVDSMSTKCPEQIYADRMQTAGWQVDKGQEGRGGLLWAGVSLCRDEIVRQPQRSNGCTPVSALWPLKGALQGEYHMSKCHRTARNAMAEWQGRGGRGHMGPLRAQHAGCEPLGP